MSKVQAEEKRYIYTVRHDIYGTAEVSGRDAAEASAAAARHWGVPWREIAGWCDVRRGEEVRESRCAACGGTYYGQPGGICLECMRRRAYKRAAGPRIRRRDRRTE